MKTWIVEPRDTLIVRDGRPLQEGATRMQSVDFPWPSTIAGFVRSRVGMDKRGHFALTPEQAKEIQVRGPWLVELDDNGRIVEHYVPAPRDCIWHPCVDKDEKEFLERRSLSLMPETCREGCVTDLDGAMQFVYCSTCLPPGKKLEKVPAFWKWNDVLAWLRQPPALSQLATDFGLAAPIHERRFHVAIDERTGAARDEHLFSTDGLRFTAPKLESPRRAQKRLGIALQCDDARLKEGLAIVGGERRISFLREAKGSELPRLPVDFKLGNERIARVILLTPAIFSRGFAPASFGEGTKVIAAVVDRPEVISGWDYATNGPKETRRMAPAGSVYWVKLDEKVNPKSWAERIWMQCVSDADQDKLDGFGLAVVGVG